MRIGDVSYFAPDIPFSAVDLTGETLPDQLLARIEGYYLGAADHCVRQGFAFAAGLIVVACVDAMAAFAHGPNRESRRSHDDFRAFARTRLRSFKPRANAELLYSDYRCGLVHEARLKNGAQFALGLDRTLNFEGLFPVIDAARLLSEVREAVYELIDEMRSSEPFREHVAIYVRRVFAREIAESA